MHEYDMGDIVTGAGGGYPYDKGIVVRINSTLYYSIMVQFDKQPGVWGYHKSELKLVSKIFRVHTDNEP